MFMKKLFLMTAVALLGLSSCQNEEIPGAGTGEETTISLTAALDGMAARTTIEETGVGTSADRCLLQIFEKQGDNYVAYGDQIKTTVSDRMAQFNDVRVISGKTYKFVFWADKGDNTNDKYYNTADLTNITFKDGIDYTVNNEERDAFFGATELTVTANTNETVVLRRPFGQINLSTTDLASVPEAKRPNQVKVTYTQGGYTQFNALTGDVTGSPTTSTVSTVTTVMDATNGYMVMDYLFMPTGTTETLVNFSTEFLRDNNVIATNDQTSNIPMRRNFRTNISGSLLTNGANFTVTINPEFDGQLPTGAKVYGNSETDMNIGGNWIVKDFTDQSGRVSINLTKLDLQNDLNLTLAMNNNNGFSAPTVIIGSNTENAHHITITIPAGAMMPKFATGGSETIFEDGKPVDAKIEPKFLNNLTIINKSNQPLTTDIASNTITTVKNVTFDGLIFSDDHGFKFSEGVQNLSDLTIKNCAASGLKTKSFVKIAAKNSSDVTIENNAITFDPASSDAYNNASGLDGAEIWYMNGGTLTFKGNTVNGGSNGIVSLPANAAGPDEMVIENNKFYSGVSAINIQQPNKNITVKGNQMEGNISFMLYKAANNPNITITGNTLMPPANSNYYAITAFGYKTAWGGNETGSKATIVCKDNVKAGDKAKNWAGWFFLLANTQTELTLNDGSDVDTPYKN